MRILQMVILAALLCACDVLHCQTPDDNRNRCNDNNPDLSIGGCTALIQSGQETDADLAIEFYNRGNAYNNKGEFDRAIQDYDAAIRLNPSYADAFYNQGNAYNNKGEFDRAIQDYDAAIRLSPNYALVFYNRGDAYNSKGEFDRAIQDYDEAIRLNPSYAYAFNNRGLAYSNKGDYDRAIQDFDQAVKLKPDYKNPQRGRGAAHFEMGHFDEAEQDFAETLKADPSDAYTALWLYLAQARAGHQGRNALEQNSKQVKLTAWPGQAIELYLGAATPAAVLSAAEDPDLLKNKGQHCEAYFFLAEKALLANDRASARNLFQKAVDTGAFGEHQYVASQAELKRLPTASMNPHQ